MENMFYGLPYKEGYARSVQTDKDPEYRELTPMYKEMVEQEREYVGKLERLLDLPFHEWKKQWEARIQSGELKPHTP